MGGRQAPLGVSGLRKSFPHAAQAEQVSVLTIDTNPPQVFRLCFHGSVRGAGKGVNHSPPPLFLWRAGDPGPPSAPLYLLQPRRESLGVAPGQPPLDVGANEVLSMSQSEFE